ncbi:unnamed protein product [Caenorhabditis nigoni]
MKGALLLSAILIILAVYINAQEKKCCAWPVKSFVTISTNISRWDFICDEPISISCQNTGYGFIKIGIAGLNDGDTTGFTRLVEDERMLTKSFVCRPHQWSMVGDTNKYDRFSCIFQKPDGDWVGL